MRGTYLDGGLGFRLPPSPEMKKIVLIFNVKNYTKIWTLLKMYTWNVLPRPSLFSCLDTQLAFNDAS